jgi:hypothetical protein
MIGYLIGGLIVALVLLLTGVVHFPRRPVGTLPLQTVHEVSYMPYNAGWSAMWTDWEPSLLRRNYETLAAFGANTVRIIIPPFTMGYPIPTPTMRERLAALLSLASANRLHVQLTLFDQFGNYDRIAASRLFIRSLLAPYKDDRNIVFIELQNEIDPYDAQAIAWARALLPVLRSTIGNIPDTLSTPGSLGPMGVAALKAALGDTQLSLYDFHFYGAGGQAASTFARVKAIVAPAPLFIGEAGMSTSSGPSSAISESEQANFFYVVEGAATALGLPLAAPWTFYDFTANTILPGMAPSQMYFGLYRTDGLPKPAAGVVARFFAHGQQPCIENGNFELISDGVPSGWVPTNLANGTFRVDNTVAYIGSHSVSISHTAGSVNAQPAWTTVANTGQLTAGQRLEATVWARGSVATGDTVIAIAWFNSNGIYIGNATSYPLQTGTTSWTLLDVKAAVPFGAAYEEVSLESFENTGSVWFDAVQLHSS